MRIGEDVVNSITSTRAALLSPSLCIEIAGPGMRLRTTAAHTDQATAS
jgi:hypothetical protein